MLIVCCVQAAKKYGVEEALDTSRILCITGDLGTPGLGLTAQQRDMLAATVDVIVHSGSLVNFIQPYQTLKTANVGGTVVRLYTFWLCSPFFLILCVAFLCAA